MHMNLRGRELNPDIRVTGGYTNHYTTTDFEIARKLAPERFSPETVDWLEIASLQSAIVQAVMTVLARVVNLNTDRTRSRTWVVAATTRRPNH